MWNRICLSPHACEKKVFSYSYLKSSRIYVQNTLPQMNGHKHFNNLFCTILTKCWEIQNAGWNKAAVCSVHH